MRFMPGKIRIALAAMVMCLGLTAVSGGVAEARNSSNFGIFIGPGNGHHYNHFYDREYGGFPFYRFNNPTLSTSFRGLPYFSQGYYGFRMRQYRANYRRAHFKERHNYRGHNYRRHRHLKRSGIKRNRWCHYHKSKLRGVKKHSKVRCHKHRKHRHRSIVHTR